MDIEIPFEYASTGKYQATLGHKMNHNFDPGTIVEITETARYDFRFDKGLPMAKYIRLADVMCSLLVEI